MCIRDLKRELDEDNILRDFMIPPPEKKIRPNYLLILLEQEKQVHYSSNYTFVPNVFFFI